MNRNGRVPQAPPGVPAGMAPPRAPPPGAARQPATAMEVDPKTSTEGEERDGEQEQKVRLGSSPTMHGLLET